MAEQAVYDMKEYRTVAEAAKAVDFPVLIPAVLETEAIRRICVIGGKCVTIEYVNRFCYRTGEGSDDISGDYNHYQDTDAFTIGSYQVTAKGCYGKIFLATWTDGNNAYSFYTPYGASKKMYVDLIESLAQPDIAVPEQLSNPMVPYDYIFEAEYALGYAIYVPTVLPESGLEKIYVIGGEVAELLYHNNVTYRMAMGEIRDISGVFGNFPHIEKFDVQTEMGVFHVTAKGSHGLFTVAIWDCEDIRGTLNGSISTEHGVKRGMIESLLKSLRLAD